MVIYAFEKLGIIFSVIIFHFKEPVSNINTESPSPRRLPLACVVFPHLLFLFSLSFQGFGICFQTFTHAETHTAPSPFLLPFSFYSGFGNSLLFYSASPSCGWRSSRLLGWEVPLGPGRQQGEGGREVGLGRREGAGLRGIVAVHVATGPAGRWGQRPRKPSRPWGRGCAGALRALEMLAALRCPGSELRCPGRGAGEPEQPGHRSTSSHPAPDHRSLHLSGHGCSP